MMPHEYVASTLSTSVMAAQSWRCQHPAFATSQRASRQHAMECCGTRCLFGDLGTAAPAFTAPIDSTRAFYLIFGPMRLLFVEQEQVLAAKNLDHACATSFELREHIYSIVA